jgi:signal peptide peptidase SppA
MSAFRYARHWGRIFNRPLLIEQTAFDAMLPGIERAFRLGSDREYQAYLSHQGERSQETRLGMLGSVAVIPVMGPLVHRGRYDAECNFLKGYQDVAKDLRAAAADESATEIVLSIDSPGGEVAGCFDLSRNIKSLAGGKPVTALINDVGCSGAYAIASGADRIVTTDTAQIGSIGVLMRHEDYSAYLEKLGVDVTMIYAGKHKTDASPYGPLTPAVKAKLQAEVNELYGMFVNLVAEGRGLDKKAVMATEADVFLGDSAMDRGLVDAIVSPDAFLEELAAEAAASSQGTVFAMSPAHQSKESETMNAIPEAITAALGLPADASEGDVLSAMTSRTDAAVSAERERVLSILRAPEAQGRTNAAIELAAVAAITAESAIAILSKMPAEATEQSKADNQFAAMMQSLNPEVGMSDGDDDDGKEQLAKEARNGWVKAFGIESAS